MKHKKSGNHHADEFPKCIVNLCHSSQKS